MEGSFFKLIPFILLETSFGFEPDVFMSLVTTQLSLNFFYL